MTSLTPVDFKKGRAHAPRLSPPRVPGRHSDRFWSPEEDAVLVAHYATGGVQACEANLVRLGTPKRAKTAIYQRAGCLGLKSAGQSSKPRQRCPELRSGAMDDRIRSGWAELHGHGAVLRFAEELGIPRTELSRRALNLGLTAPHKKEPSWTSAEDSLLPSLPLHDLHRSAAVMREHGYHRTPAAIGVRAKRLSISRRRSDVFSGTSAARLLGVDNKTTTSWCIDGRLTASRRGTDRLPQQGGDTWTITPADLRQFVIDNIDRIDIRKVDKHAFVDLLITGGKAETSGLPPAAGPHASLSLASPEMTRPAPTLASPSGTANPARWALQGRRTPRRSLDEILADCGREDHGSAA